jgi:hypothetical protein
MPEPPPVQKSTLPWRVCGVSSGAAVECQGTLAAHLEDVVAEDGRRGHVAQHDGVLVLVRHGACVCVSGLWDGGGVRQAARQAAGVRAPQPQPRISHARLSGQHEPVQRLACLPDYLVQSRGIGRRWVSRTRARGNEAPHPAHAPPALALALARLPPHHAMPMSLLRRLPAPRLLSRSSPARLARTPAPRSMASAADTAAAAAPQTRLTAVSSRIRDEYQRGVRALLSCLAASRCRSAYLHRARHTDALSI